MFFDGRRWTEKGASQFVHSPEATTTAHEPFDWHPSRSHPKEGPWEYLKPEWRERKQWFKFFKLFFCNAMFDFQIHSQFVENVLGVHKKYRDLIKEVFKDDQSYVGALDKACTHVINHRVNPRIPSKSPEMVNANVYFDLLLTAFNSSWPSIATLCCVKLPKEFLKMKWRKSLVIPSPSSNT